MSPEQSAKVEKEWPSPHLSEEEWKRAIPRDAHVQLVDKQGNIHNLIDPGEIGEGEDPGHSTFRKQPKDWARRSGDGKWTPNAIG